MAALSKGQTVEAKQFYRDLKPALAVAQRAGHNILASGMLVLEREFAAEGEAKTGKAAVNKYGQPFWVGHDLPVAGIIAPLGW